MRPGQAGKTQDASAMPICKTPQDKHTRSRSAVNFFWYFAQKKSCVFSWMRVNHSHTATTRRNSKQDGKMTQKELDEVLRLHLLWLDCANDGAMADLRGANLRWAHLSGANLSGADLSGANLREANLRCFGDMTYIKTMQIEKWEIGYSSDELQIGCNRHSIARWREWDTETGLEWIANMDSLALESAVRFLPLLLQIITASPAQPTGYEVKNDQED